MFGWEMKYIVYCLCQIKSRGLRMDLHKRNMHPGIKLRLRTLKTNLYYDYDNS